MWKFIYPISNWCSRWGVRFNNYVLWNMKDSSLNGDGAWEWDLAELKDKKK